MSPNSSPDETYDYQDVRAIPDQDRVSRVLFRPRMVNQDNDLIWNQVFQFQSSKDNVESVFWRRFDAETDEQVHQIGRKMNDGDRRQYDGFLSAVSKDVRSVGPSENGCIITLEHCPENGVYAHANMQIKNPQGGKLPKGDKTHLKVLLREVFFRSAA